MVPSEATDFDEHAEQCDCARLLVSYERLASIYHELLGQRSLDALLAHIADAVGLLVPCSALLIAEVDAERELVVPMLARGAWSEETLQMRLRYGEGLLGWAIENVRPVLANEAHCDPRAGHVAGTPQGEPEALISIPFVSRGAAIGGLSLYREGAGESFTPAEFRLAQHFADAATLALSTATTRAQLETLSRTDDLTGLLNRRGFYERGTEILDRSDEGRATALVLVDLDLFKRINDRHGHAAGDVVLKQVARQLEAAAPAEAAIARIGGDEFAIVVPDSGSEQIDALAESLARAIEDLRLVIGQGIVSTAASVGTAVLVTGETATLDHLLHRADAAMYATKTDRTGSRARRDATPRLR